MPLSDRDYMRTPPPAQRPARYGSSWGFSLSPVWTIILINLVMYIATLVSGEGRFPLGEYYEVISDRFTYYLALIPYYFPSRPWTIITNMFVHAGFWHLFGNMITFYFFGSFLARLVGNKWLLLVYFGGGILGNVLYLLLGAPDSIAIGASGAVYAVAGMLVVLMPKIRVLLYFIIPMPLWVVVLVFFGLWSIPGFMTTNVAWQAHLGGLVAGVAAGYFFRRRWPRIYYSVR